MIFDQFNHELSPERNQAIKELFEAKVGRSFAAMPTRMW